MVRTRTIWRACHGRGLQRVLTERQAGHLPDILGLEWLEARGGYVKGRFTVAKHHMAPNGFLHAASVIALADSACGYGCMISLPEGGASFTTIELKSNFLGTAREGGVAVRGQAGPRRPPDSGLGRRRDGRSDRQDHRPIPLHPDGFAAKGLTAAVRKAWEEGLAYRTGGDAARYRALDLGRLQKATRNGGLERWQSGRMYRTRNAACLEGHRGFESHPLRQLATGADRCRRSPYLLSWPFVLLLAWPTLEGVLRRLLQSRFPARPASAVFSRLASVCVRRGHKVALPGWRKSRSSPSRTGPFCGVVALVLTVNGSGAERLLIAGQPTVRHHRL
jgi:uncharacterized protein (TIGR00369 family)